MLEKLILQRLNWFSVVNKWCKLLKKDNFTLLVSLCQMVSGFVQSYRNVWSCFLTRKIHKVLDVKLHAKTHST